MRGIKEFIEINGVVNEEFNPYKEITILYGREERETNIPDPYGAVSLREWSNGIIVKRIAKYDFQKDAYILQDSAIIPKSKEFLDLIERLRGIKEKR
jgi:hypothetical protein